MPRPKNIDWDAEPLLGRVDDNVLAQKYGVGRTSVRAARLCRSRRPRQIEAGDPNVPVLLERIRELEVEVRDLRLALQMIKEV